jgi:hypothetical protein
MAVPVAANPYLSIIRNSKDLMSFSELSALPKPGRRMILRR